MFRRYCKFGFVIIGAGVGMLLSCLLQVSALCIFCGIGLIILGTLLLRNY